MNYEVELTRYQSHTTKILIEAESDAHAEELAMRDMSHLIAGEPGKITTFDPDSINWTVEDDNVEIDNVFVMANDDEDHHPEPTEPEYNPEEPEEEGEGEGR